MTLKNIFTALLLSVLLISCSKKDDGNVTPTPVTAPDKISPNRLTFNNINLSSVPAGSIYYVYAQLYVGNVLLSTTAMLDLTSNTLPASAIFNFPAQFSYLNNSFDLKIYGEAGATDYLLGTINLKLADYSSDKYPKPAELFYNLNGNAGTLYLDYQ